ncbi:HlyD family type I secretion periplasmic adaptor subunit [Parasphingorhabdus flavimaris]|jgi:membrane fusion protein, adhesin transport system|uniref:Membrane fusion protein (MFP) family protein n=1 Tax=Parasphingorhabdus flavimaris TaxID=266812 RepID=A0ABX2N3U8_9SPHN|nr:HlyD family type I secretion periplasmic adaptor subunit [Parasphingorhabdus flavimaris]NVD28385.1 HlyD family type I secretion periplasmic adaptor subunit [Parasphingorhabdus flavimaris]|tara:strand:+ start:4270 stop:5538 length:1269 start_codon:yes stop_codon:yes gene_type:complete
MKSLLSSLSRLNGSQRILLIGALGLFLFLVWASLAQVDEITRGQGRVIPSSKVQVVQASDPSTVSDILVRSGEQVKKGQLLARLDDTDSSSELGQIQAENRSLSARAARLGQEGRGTASDCPPGAPCAEEAVLQQTRQAALRSRLSGLSAAIEQRRRDQSEAQATVSSLQSSVKLARDQVNLLQPLAAKSIIPQTELMTAQRELVDLQGRLAAARQSVGRAGAAVREAQAQLSEANLQFRQEALNERSQVAAKIAVNQESIRGAQGRLERSEIRSPVDGIVNDVQITTIGGFVGPGEKIMQVVPIGDKLLIEARVRPSDIAFIRVNDRANVKVTAYDFSIYGGLQGNVVQVSADSIYDEVKQEAYFTVIVETDQAWLQSGGKKLPITPGMICDVEILTGRKSILSYLLKPVLRARSQALTER